MNDWKMAGISKKIFLLAFVLLVSAAFVSAYSTEIKVKTVPYQKVSIFVLDSSQTYYLIESFHRTSDANGDVAVVSNTDKSKIDVMVKVTEPGSTAAKFLEKFEEYDAGKPISIRVDYDEVTGQYVPQKAGGEGEGGESEAGSGGTESQESSGETSSESGESESGKKAITGGVVSERNIAFPNLAGAFSKVPRYSYYALAGLVLVAIIVFFLRRGGVELPPHLSGAPASASSASISAIKASVTNGYAGKIRDGPLAEAERKLAEAQKEIQQIKSRKQRLSDAEKRFEEARKELEKAKKESY